PFRTAETAPTEPPTERTSASQTDVPSAAKPPASPFAAISESLGARTAAEENAFPRGLFTPRQPSQSAPPSNSPFDVPKGESTPDILPAPAVEAKSNVQSASAAMKAESTPFSTPAPQKTPF